MREIFQDNTILFTHIKQDLAHSLFMVVLPGALKWCVDNSQISRVYYGRLLVLATNHSQKKGVRIRRCIRPSQQIKGACTKAVGSIPYAAVAYLDLPLIAAYGSALRGRPNCGSSVSAHKKERVSNIPLAGRVETRTQDVLVDLGYLLIPNRTPHVNTATLGAVKSVMSRERAHVKVSTLLGRQRGNLDWRCRISVREEK
jgi:hypothetical protein